MTDPIPKVFAIDYDATWTADPVAFAAFAELLRRRGHRVLLVTARVSGHAEPSRECARFVDRILLTEGAPKREFCREFGESVDIWIDDMPEMISSTWSPPPDHASSPRVDLAGPPPGWERYSVRDDVGVPHEAAGVRRKAEAADLDAAWATYNLEANPVRRECADVLTSAGEGEAATTLTWIADELDAAGKR